MSDANSASFEFNSSFWTAEICLALLPIIVTDLYVMLDALEGVQTVKNVILTNKAGTTSGYSEWAYDMNGANQNGTIFPSLDPSIFEIKYPNTDIKGSVVKL